MSSKKYSKSRKDDHRLSIPDFFWGKSVFITGATGFMGKVLVEKLLRSCPGIEKIYFLMRPKKGKSLEERLAEMIALPLFTKVRREDTSTFKKLVPLKGDAREKNLGLSKEDQEILIQQVSVVFHVAACVRFDDPLKQAVLLNTRGTYEVLQLAKQMKNLESFLHVSTTYCNTHKDVIEEEIYPPPGDWKTLIKLAENVDQETLEVFGPKIIGGYPNTYTYTKGLAEHVVDSFKEHVPTVIFRPSIVISSYLEPMPGWVDNFNGPVALLVASGKGIVNTIYSDPNISADYVPVDMAVKAMIVAAWERATTNYDYVCGYMVYQSILYRSSNPVEDCFVYKTLIQPMKSQHEASPEETKTRVYNCSSYGIKSITQKELGDVALYVVKTVPLNDTLWYPHGSVTNWKVIHYIRVLIFHILLSVIVDTVLKLLNRKPMLLKVHRRIFVANMALAYFLTKQWSFRNDKLFQIESKMLDDDRPAFSYRVNDVDVIDYFTSSAYGVREYLLKEDNTDLPEAQKHQWRMYWLDKVVRVATLFFVGFLAYKWEVITIIRRFLFDILGLFYQVFFN